MSSWTRHKLNELFANSVPGEWGAEPRGDGSDLLVLRSTNFRRDGKIDYSDVVERSIPQHRLKNILLKEGNILLEKSGGGPDQPVGRVVYYDGSFDGKCLSSNFIQKLEVRDEFNSKFVFYILFQNYVAGLVLRYQQQTTGLINFKLSEYLREVVNLPTRQDQDFLASILSTIDNVIEKTEVLIEKYRSIKQGMMHDLFTRGVTENGELRPPYYEAPHLYRESELGWIPKEWDIDALGQSCLKGGGSIQTGPFGSQLHASDYKDEGTPIITVEHLGENEILHENLPLVGSADRKRLEHFSLQIGDLVFSRVGAIDRCAYVSSDEDGWLFSGRCLRVRAGRGSLKPRFLSYQLNSSAARQWILNHSVGSTMRCLNTKILSGVPMLIPAYKEQEIIATIIENCDKKIRIENNYRDKLDFKKMGLMQDLLTGKVTVKVEKAEEAANV